MAQANGRRAARTSALSCGLCRRATVSTTYSALLQTKDSSELSTKGSIREIGLDVSAIALKFGDRA